jgi:hypothetical protein
MFGAFGSLDDSGNLAGAAISLGALAARTAAFCDPAWIAAARPVPICSKRRREMELTGPALCGSGVCSLFGVPDGAGASSSAAILGVFTIVPIALGLRLPCE